MKNVLLILVDCLRYDRVFDGTMPELLDLSNKSSVYTNFWSTSHSTDPAITSLIFGAWPDESGVYAMVQEVSDYDIADSIKSRSLFDIAAAKGYNTHMVSNLGRWYKRTDGYTNVTTLPDPKLAIDAGSKAISELDEPWFAFIHDVSCHIPYRDGSYDDSCRAVSRDIANVMSNIDVDNTVVIITSDHGEALGEHDIQTHGYGVWPVLTHVPLVMWEADRKKVFNGTCQHVDLYDYIVTVMNNKQPKMHYRRYAHIAGKVHNVWHRAIVFGSTMLFKQQITNGETTYTMINTDTDEVIKTDMKLWEYARKHAATFNVDADTCMSEVHDMNEIARKLKALGYYE